MVIVICFKVIKIMYFMLLVICFYKILFSPQKFPMTLIYGLGMDVI